MPGIEADVLVIGGGLAGCWAAVAAARGASVVLAEKVIAAPAGSRRQTGHCGCRPDPNARGGGQPPLRRWRRPRDRR